LLEYIEHPWEDVLYEQGDAPNYSIECWTSVKNTLGLDFPNVPYLIDEEVKITDSNAIMIYLCNAYCPELLGTDLEQKSEIDMIYGQLKEVRQALTGPCYVGADRQVLKRNAKAKISGILKHLGTREFVAGNSLTYLDFYTLELYEFIQFLTQDEFYDENPLVKNYVKRIMNLR